jgi:hypothetical protein
MARGDILAKIEKSQKSPTLTGRHGNCKPNIKNLFDQILVNIPKILHVKNEEDPVENKKMARSDVVNWVNEKMFKFRPLPRPVDMRYFHISVHLKVARTV